MKCCSCSVLLSASEVVGSILTKCRFISYLVPKIQTIAYFKTGHSLKIFSFEAGLRLGSMIYLGILLVLRLEKVDVDFVQNILLSNWKLNCLPECIGLIYSHELPWQLLMRHVFLR